jgi:hypothetical protein
VIETYSANLGLRPEGLPPLAAFFSRTNLYDKDRVSQDISTDLLSLQTKYTPYRNLDLRAQASFTDRTDRLSDVNTKEKSYSGQASYSRQFGKRVSAHATYNFSHSETETIAGGAGEVDFQVFPFAGLSAISDTPQLVTLDQNPALIDGDVAASSGINLGPVPVGGDNRLRNIGLDFVIPSEVNRVFLWVDRDLPPSVSNSFRWDIYVSSDNVDWTFLQTVTPAPFSTFFNRFEINFSKVATRYLKVVSTLTGP